MNRAQLTEKILDAKRAKGLSWKTICPEIGGNSPALITAALLGQMRLDPAQAKKAAALFKLSRDGAAMLTGAPCRGSLPPGPPTDPLIYRFYEAVRSFSFVGAQKNYVERRRSAHMIARGSRWRFAAANPRMI